MSVTRRDAIFAGAAAVPAAGLLLSAARAQPPAGAPAGMGDDPLLAACLLITGRRQIESCKFAKERCQNDDCKAFAQAEIDEHEHIKDNLQKLGFTYPGVPAAQGVQPAGAVAGAVPVMVGRVLIPPPASTVFLIDHEVADQCVANFKKGMEKKQGAKFDRAFVGDQLHAHYGLLDHAQVFSKHATAQMQPTLKEGLDIIHKHIATLEGLMQKLDRADDK